MDVLPEDRSLLPKFNSDVCKWHLFFSNLTEDVFQVVQEIFALDYARQLKFQSISEQEESADQTPASVSISIPDKDELITCRFFLFPSFCLNYKPQTHSLHSALCFLTRCLSKVGSASKRHNSPSSSQRHSLSKLSSLASGVSKVYPPTYENSLHF